jgi:hypothetical protein
VDRGRSRGWSSSHGASRYRRKGIARPTASQRPRAGGACGACSWLWRPAGWHATRARQQSRTSPAAPITAARRCRC